MLRANGARDVDDSITDDVNANSDDDEDDDEDDDGDDDDDGDQGLEEKVDASLGLGATLGTLSSDSLEERDTDNESSVGSPRKLRKGSNSSLGAASAATLKKIKGTRKRKRKRKMKMRAGRRSMRVDGGAISVPAVTGAWSSFFSRPKVYAASSPIIAEVGRPGRPVRRHAPVRDAQLQITSAMAAARLADKDRRRRSRKQEEADQGELALEISAEEEEDGEERGEERGKDEKSELKRQGQGQDQATTGFDLSFASSSAWTWNGYEWIIPETPSPEEVV